MMMMFPISDLPDDILPSIIRWLPMREAVRLSIVCKQWRHLWASSIAHIDLDQAHMVGYPVRYSDDMTDEAAFALDRERALRFTRTVDRFLLCLQHVSKLDSFRLRFPMAGGDSSHAIDRWINFAAEKQVEKLDINLNGGETRFPLHRLNGAWGHCLQHLRLSCFFLDAPPNFTGFLNLRSLEIFGVDIGDNQHLQSIISRCHLLESLSLRLCNGLKQVRISPQLCRLKRLTLKFSVDEDDETYRVTISSSTKLVSLECNVPISLCNESAIDITNSAEPAAADQDFIVAPSPDLCRFVFLKDMTLEGLDFSKQDLTELFRACLHLERLVLSKCNLRCIGIPPRHGLRYLDIDDDGSTLGGTINICGATDLVSLNYKGGSSRIKFLDCKVYELPFFPSARLHFKHCIFQRGAYAAVKNLRVLFLDNVKFRDKWGIWSLLSHCQQLERLGLGGHCQLRHFSIPYPSHPLKYLELENYNRSLEKLELCSENLIQLELHSESNVSIQVKQQAPKLVRVTIGGKRPARMAITLGDLGRLIPRLETLILIVHRFGSKAEIMTGFKHLKKLVILVTGYLERKNLMWMVSLLESAPILEKLELHFGGGILFNHNPDETMRADPKHASSHLKELKISGFTGNKLGIEMALYLIKYASSLELLTIDSQSLIYEGADNWSAYEGYEHYMLGSKYIRELFTKEVSSSCRLVIL